MATKTLITTNAMLTSTLRDIDAAREMIDAILTFADPEEDCYATMDIETLRYIGAELSLLSRLGSAQLVEFTAKS